MAKKKAANKKKTKTKSRRSFKAKSSTKKARRPSARKVVQAKAKGKSKKTSRRPAPRRESAPKKSASKALASGCQWINPYLTVRDVQAAIDFYQNGFGFQVRTTMTGPDGNIMHAEMMHQDSLLMLGPENPEMGALAPQGVSPVTLYAYVENVDDIASRASSNGGRLIQPPEDKFWGDRCCIIVDPAGHTWMLATHVKDVPPEEMIPPGMETPPTM